MLGQFGGSGGGGQFNMMGGKGGGAGAPGQSDFWQRMMQQQGQGAPQGQRPMAQQMPSGMQMGAQPVQQQALNPAMGQNPQLQALRARAAAMQAGGAFGNQPAPQPGAQPAGGVWGNTPGAQPVQGQPRYQGAMGGLVR